MGPNSSIVTPPYEGIVHWPVAIGVAFVRAGAGMCRSCSNAGSAPLPCLLGLILCTESASSMAPDPRAPAIFVSLSTIPSSEGILSKLLDLLSPSYVDVKNVKDVISGVSAPYTTLKTFNTYTYEENLTALEARVPDHIARSDWELAVADAKRFLVQWGSREPEPSVAQQWNDAIKRLSIEPVYPQWRISRSAMCSR
jgi:hypothetical protein